MEIFMNIFNRILHADPSFSFYNISKEEHNKAIDDIAILNWIKENISLSYRQLHIMMQYMYTCSLWESCKYVCIKYGYRHDWMWFYNHALSKEQNIEKVLNLINILRQSPNYCGIDYYGLIRITKLLHNEAIYNEADLQSLERLMNKYPKSVILSQYIIGERFIKSLRHIWITACIISN